MSAARFLTGFLGRMLAAVVGSAVAGIMLGLVWGMVLWILGTYGERLLSFWIIYLPSVLLWIVLVLLARWHGSAIGAVVGAAVGPAVLVVTQVLVISLLDGPPEEIRIGGAIVLGQVFVAAPMFVAAGVTSGIVAWRAGRGERWGRAGRCPGCGYARAGLPALAPCPECGRTA
jgi:hypothetical protein